MKAITREFLLILSICLPLSSVFSQNLRHEQPQQTVCLSENHQTTPITFPEGITSIFSEDFSTGCPPSGWTIVGDGQSNWLPSSTNNAGGAAPEGMFSWTPQFEGVSRLVSPEINTSGNDALVFEFKQMLNDYSGDYTLLVETTSDGTTWNEVWSVNVTGDIDAETVSFLIDNGDVGSENFQIAFTYNGNSFNVNNWYIDDVILMEALTLDVGVISLDAPALAPSGEAVTTNAVVKNYGTQTVDFEVSMEVFESSTLVYSATENVNALATTEEEELVFSQWIPTSGIYEIIVTSNLSGDENPANNSMGQVVQIIDNVIAKKPCFEEFTSSTCIPCAGTNPIIDQVLYSNPGEYSLIKYQTSWPGAGDPYYTEQGGVRTDYYGVTAVPELYCNSDQIAPALSFNQEIFDFYAEQLTGLEIEVTASIQDESTITVDATINSYANYDAGLMARIVVVEKTTYGNIGTNSEEEFHNVMMVMLPDADGTELAELAPGDQIDISESYDMTTTFMEQPNDLMVIVFVQDDTDKSVVQSEMVDVTGTFNTYSVTFNVEDSDGNPVNEANITFDINGPMETGANGQAVYAEVFPGTYDYEVTKGGLLAATGTVEVTDENESVDVVLQVPDFYFYEDFANGIPNDWTIYSSSGNSTNLYWYDGFVVFWMQNANDLIIQLMTPEINLSQAGTLFFEAGEAFFTPNILVGTVSDPSDPESFNEIASFTLTSTMDEYMLELEGLPITDSYLAFRYDGPATGYFYFDNVKLSVSSTALPVPSELTAVVDDNDVLLSWDAPVSKDLLGYNVFRDGEEIDYTTQTEYTDVDLENGFYEYYVTAVYDEGESGPSNTATANVGNVLVYCESEGGGGQYFTLVQLNGINNSSGFEGFGNFTDLSTDLQQGQTYELTVNVASPNTGDDIGIWIDFNQDGVFDETENLVCEMDNSQSVASWDIEIPSDAVLGTTRLRLKEKYWEIGCDPCGYTTWGETEDYSVNIVEFTGINNPVAESLDIYPNPASNLVNIQSEFDILSLKVYNYSGQLIVDESPKNLGYKLNTSNFERGIYLFRVETTQGIQSKRIVLQ